MDSRIITLTPAAFKYGNLNIRPCGLEFFPKGIVGGPTKVNLGTLIRIEAKGLTYPIETDIPIDRYGRRPRWIFRKRKWVQDFVHINKLLTGDKVQITRVDERSYFVCPTNKSVTSKSQRESKNHRSQAIGMVRKLKANSRINRFLNILFEGDCLEIMPDIPSKSIDMVLCDLPYGFTQNKWDSAIPLDKLWSQYERIIKDRGSIVLTSQGLFTAKLILSNEKMFRYKITWIKSKPTNFLNAKKQPLRKHEDICVFYKSQPTYNPQMLNGLPYNKGIRKDQFTGSYGEFKPVEVKSGGERYPSDVVYFKTAESEGQVWHPTQKPVELGRYLIRTFTNPGDIVLDNAFGSGSFLVAALLEGRNFIGIEKNREVHLFKKKPIDYIKLARERLDKARKDVEQSRSLFEKNVQHNEANKHNGKRPTQRIFF